MNRTIATSLVLLALSAAGSLRAQLSPDDSAEHSDKIRYQLILPDEKAPEQVKPSEPNPFSKADTHILKEDGASGEENRVREILSNMAITGYAEGGPGQEPRVMVGPMKLKKGDTVPKVMAEQTVSLRVNAISREQVDLIWVEKKHSGTGIPPRVVTLRVNVLPKVRRALPGISPALADAAKKGPANFIYQDTRESDPGLPSGSPPETRRAVAVDGSSPPAAPPAPGSVDAKLDPAHPANMLMHMLFDKVSKTMAPQQSANK